MYVLVSIISHKVCKREYKVLKSFTPTGYWNKNLLLIEKGLARVAIYQPDVKYVDKFREIQKKFKIFLFSKWFSFLLLFTSPYLENQKSDSKTDLGFEFSDPKNGGMRKVQQSWKHFFTVPFKNATFRDIAFSVFPNIQ